MTPFLDYPLDRQLFYSLFQRKSAEAAVLGCLRAVPALARRVAVAPGSQCLRPAADPWRTLRSWSPLAHSAQHRGASRSSARRSRRLQAPGVAAGSVCGCRAGVTPRGPACASRGRGRPVPFVSSRPRPERACSQRWHRSTYFSDAASSARYATPG